MYTSACLLSRMFQCYCVAADVAVAELKNVVVAEGTKKYLADRYERKEKKDGMLHVLDVAMYSDSPLYTLGQRGCGFAAEEENQWLTCERSQVLFHNVRLLPPARGNERHTVVLDRCRREGRQR